MPRSIALRVLQERAIIVSFIVASCLLSGCSGSSSPVDTALQLAIPADWSSLAADSVRVPGDVVGAWKAPGGSVVIIFQCLPTPGAQSKLLADELANRLINLPGAVVSNVTPIAGHESVSRVDAVALGDGSSWAPSGLGEPKGEKLIPTHLTAVVLPRRSATYWLYAYHPESSAVDNSTIDDMIKSWDVVE